MKNFLIDGFPRAMEQALYLDKYMQEIMVILNVYAPDDILIKRLKSRGINSGRADDQDEKIILDRINVFKSQSLPVINFYSKYGVVKNINSAFDVNQVYKCVKEQLIPEIYCIVGKRYSGKTTIAKILVDRMKMKYINFDDVLNHPFLEKRKGDIEFLIQFFLTQLRQLSDHRVIIKNFPLKKEYYSLFVKNGKNINKIIYLDSDPFVCSQRMKSMGKDHPDYIGCGKLRQLNDEFEANIDLLNSYRSKGILCEVSSDLSLDLVADQVIRALEPKIFVLRSENYIDRESNQIVQKLEKENDFKVIDVEEAIKETIQRGRGIGISLMNSQEDSKERSLLIVEMLKPILFNEQSKKYLLLKFPSTTEQVNY